MGNLTNQLVESLNQPNPNALTKGLASYCKAETTFTFNFSILTLSNALLGIDNREMKSESGFSFAIASQPFSHRNYQTKTYQLKPAKHNLHSELLIGFKLSGRQKNFSPGSVVQLAVLISNGPAPLVIQPALEGNELLWRLFNDKQPTKGFRLLHCDLQISPRSPRS